MSKKDHKGIASDLVKDLINNAPTPPLQKLEGEKVSPVIKKSTHKFTAEFDEDWMESVRLYAVKKKIKLKNLFELAVSNHMEKNPNN